MVDLKGLFHDLVRFETQAWTVIDARLLRECELPLTWLEIMRMLQRCPASRVQDLAEEFVISVGGASKVVDRIEAAGYLQRVPNPRDRRSALLELTEAGAVKVGQALPVFEAELELRLASVLGAAELERLALALRLLRASAFTDGKGLSA